MLTALTEGMQADEAALQEDALGRVEVVREVVGQVVVSFPDYDEEEGATIERTVRVTATRVLPDRSLLVELRGADPRPRAGGAPDRSGRTQALSRYRPRRPRSASAEPSSGSAVCPSRPAPSRRLPKRQAASRRRPPPRLCVLENLRGGGNAVTAFAG